MKLSGFSLYIFKQFYQLAAFGYSNLNVLFQIIITFLLTGICVIFLMAFWFLTLFSVKLSFL